MISGVWLDTAIGVALFFLVMSFVASAAVEAVAQIVALRANTLKQGIQSLLQSVEKDEGTKLLAAFYDHSLIKGLADSRDTMWSIGTSSKPSYIPSRTFAAAFLDIVTANGPGRDLALKLAAYDAAKPRFKSDPFKKLQEAAKKAQDELPEARTRGKVALDGRENEATQLKTLATHAGDAVAAERLERILAAVALDRVGFEKAASEVNAIATALTDVVNAGGPTLTPDQRKAITEAVTTLELLTSPAGRSLTAASEMISKIQQPELKRLLSTLVGEGRASVEELRTAVATWFDDSMDRVSGWYKRRVQLINFCVGLAVAIVINGDAINVMRTITANEKLRGELVALSSAVSKVEDDKARLKVIQAKSEILPIGWARLTCFVKGKSEPLTDCARDPKNGAITTPEAEQVWRNVPFGFADLDLDGRLSACLGWVITALAVMLGAPFWFDALSTLVRMRGAGKVPPTAKEATAATGGGAAP